VQEASNKIVSLDYLHRGIVIFCFAHTHTHRCFVLPIVVSFHPVARIVGVEVRKSGTNSSNCSTTSFSISRSAKADSVAQPLSIPSDAIYTNPLTKLHQKHVGIPVFLQQKHSGVMLQYYRNRKHHRLHTTYKLHVACELL
jgi:hypothetical protein